MIVEISIETKLNQEYCLILSRLFFKRPLSSALAVFVEEERDYCY